MNVNGQNLSMTRGDSETITVALYDLNETQVPFNTGDTVYFTIKSHPSQTEKILQKIITIFNSGSAIIEIVPNDTKSLPFRKYIYDIQLTRADTTVTTIIPTSIFEILEEVTYE